MKKIFLKIFGYVFTVALLTWVLWRFHDQTDWSVVLRVFDTPILSFCHLALLILCFFSFILAWQITLKCSGLDLSLKKSAEIWLIPNIGKYIPGKVLLPLARTELLHKLGIKRPYALSYFMLEHFMMILGALPFSIFSITFATQAYISLSIHIYIILVAIFICIISRPNIITHIVNACLQLLKRQPIEPSLERIPTVRLTFLYGLGWLCYGLSGLVLAYSLEMVPLQFSFFIPCALVAGWLIGFLTLIAPGGLGVRETVSVALMAPYLPPQQAIVLTIIMRFSWTLIEIGGVFIGLFLHARSNRD